MIGEVYPDAVRHLDEALEARRRLADRWQGYLDDGLVEDIAVSDRDGTGRITVIAGWPAGARAELTREFRACTESLGACLDALVAETVDSLGVLRQPREPHRPRFFPVADSPQGLDALLEESCLDGVLVAHNQLVRACQPFRTTPDDPTTVQVRDGLRQLLDWTHRLEDGALVGAWLTGGAGFASSDAELNALYQAGVRTTELNSFDAFTDCPTREQRAWVGDGVVHQMVHLVANEDWRLARNYVALGASTRPDGMLPMSVVGEIEYAGGYSIPDWALHWLHGLWNLYRHDGDHGAVLDLLPVAERVLRWYAAYVDEHGTLSDVAEWNLVDWSSVFSSARSSIVTGLWARGLRDYAEMAEWLGNTDLGSVDPPPARGRTGRGSRTSGTRNAAVTSTTSSAGSGCRRCPRQRGPPRSCPASRPRSGGPGSSTPLPTLTLPSCACGSAARTAATT